MRGIVATFITLSVMNFVPVAPASAAPADVECGLLSPTHCYHTHYSIEGQPIRTFCTVWTPGRLHITHDLRCYHLVI